MSLSTPTDGVYVFFYFIKPNGTELDTADVPKSWLSDAGIWDSSTPRPFSSTFGAYYVYFRYGVTTATVVVPLSKDRKAERNETVILQTFDYVTNPRGMTLIGTVPKHG